jgi:hypothetical protein
MIGFMTWFQAEGGSLLGSHKEGEGNREIQMKIPMSVTPTMVDLRVRAHAF